MSTTKRAAARSMGLRLAARVATVGGIAVAALGLVEARAASAAGAPHVASALGSEVAAGGNGGTATSDDARPLPMEGWAKAAAGGCGCSPCWGPPAPPRKSTSRRGRARARAKRTRSTTRAQGRAGAGR